MKKEHDQSHRNGVVKNYFEKNRCCVFIYGEGKSNVSASVSNYVAQRLEMKFVSNPERALYTFKKNYSSQKEYFEDVLWLYKKQIDQNVVNCRSFIMNGYPYYSICAHHVLPSNISQLPPEYTTDTFFSIETIDTYIFKCPLMDQEEKQFPYSNFAFEQNIQFVETNLMKKGMRWLNLKKNCGAHDMANEILDYLFDIIMKREEAKREARYKKISHQGSKKFSKPHN